MDVEGMEIAIAGRLTVNGPAPLARLEPAGARLYAKIEYLHPSGSMKHRSIPPFLESLMAGGELRPGQRIAVRSAGAAAVTLAWAGARTGHSTIAVVPPGATPNTLRMLLWLGAECRQLPPRVRRSSATARHPNAAPGAARPCL